MRFDNKRWRTILNEAASSLHSQWGRFEIISPFGFEVTGRKSCLEARLRKFYCYIGFPSHDPSLRNALCDDFYKALIFFLKKHDPPFFFDLAFLIKNEKFIKLKSDNYQCLPSNKLLDIQIRDTENIYNEYADYIISSIPSLIEKTGECQQFKECIRYRSRAFQLYVMYEHIFGYLIEKMSLEEYALFLHVHHLIDNSVQIFYSQEEMMTAATGLELMIEEILIKPRILKMLKVICEQVTNPVHIDIIDFHTYTPMKLTLDKEIYLAAQSKIIKSYKDFY
jgi:hypothetical protein